MNGQQHTEAGRGFSRPALVFALLVALAGLAFFVARLAGTNGERRAVAVANPAAAAPVESLAGTVRHVFRSEGAEHLVIDSAFPSAETRLLWFDGRPVAPAGESGSVTLDGAGGVVRFDGRLTPHRVPLRLEGREPISVASRQGGGYWVADAEGWLLQVNRDGTIGDSVATGFDYPQVIAGASDDAWAVRSTSFFAYRLASPRDPLIIHVGADGRVADSVGNIRVPAHVLLAEIANAGHLARAGDALFFAPFIRDEVMKLTPSGDTVWVAHRGLPQVVDEPRFEIGPEGPTIDYAPVNLGVAIGPDGHVYVLSVDGQTTSESRLDVFDAESGVLLRSARLPTALPTIAVTERGRVHLLDAFRLLTGVAPAEREPLAPFELELLDGGHARLADYAGRVVLINFWASWCGPCRVEMPALDSLRRGIPDADFAFITMNEDVNVKDARAFIEEYGFDFPVLLGRGRLRQTYHYIGLPFTVLIDRDGKVVQRWIGFAGEEQLAAIRAVTLAELARGGHVGGQAVGRSGGHAGH